MQRRWIESWGRAAVCFLALSLCGAGVSPLQAGVLVVDPDCDGTFRPREDLQAATVALFVGSTCPGADVNQDSRISVPDVSAVVFAVGAAATATPSPTASVTPTPTASALPGMDGPVVTFAGIANPDGCLVCDVPNCLCTGVPTRTPEFDDQGRRVFRASQGAGFLLVIEGRPGPTGFPVGTFVPAPIPSSPQRPDLQIQSTRPLGDGSLEICSGGVPAIDPPSFVKEPFVTDALIDFACRFSDFSQNNPCTLDQNGVAAFLTPGDPPPGSRQFCLQISSTERLPQDEEVYLTVRLRDTASNLGPSVQIVVHIGDP